MTSLEQLNLVYEVYEDNFSMMMDNFTNAMNMSSPEESWDATMDM